VEKSGDALALWLDGQKGHTVTDQRVFRGLAARFEREFHDDMAALGIRPPDLLTRVSEYMPEIVAMVQRIISNGFAYAVNGSVYFDTVAFARTHSYAKLRPWSVGDSSLLEEGEGSLAKGKA
jgi:cysteinyl-tRNA synthetase